MVFSGVVGESLFGLFFNHLSEMLELKNTPDTLARNPFYSF
ncbi:hypothetical Protein YC6258_00157 [Gynuella sunshinyii YC6258]|uniref:Uncharacterized protein n=1 Tax=Gynuella sunshinyii YC6258 TaxID=1445510 RepID=A0A0C5VPM9_9GAMM|nr:hypothetical Protein YC6258_00157 [Gynuella sunshinyii YC6258]